MQLIGHLGQNPEIRTLEDGKKTANLNVGTKETFRAPNGEKVTEMQWHEVVVYGKLAEIAEKYLTKGVEVAIEGKLVNRNYTILQGIKRYSTEIQANELLILTKP